MHEAFLFLFHGIDSVHKIDVYVLGIDKTVEVEKNKKTVLGKGIEGEIEIEGSYDLIDVNNHSNR